MPVRPLVLSSTLATLLGVTVLAGCPPTNEDPAVTRGRQAYLGACIACHNMNPALDGAIGPALRGSSRALLEEKVLRGRYPPGHKAKRDTTAMPPQPQMAASLDDIAAFLNAP